MADEATNAVDIIIDDFTVQYFMKDDKTDAPKFGNLCHCKAELTIPVLAEFVPFLKTYSMNLVCPDQIPYDAPAELVKKWKKKLKKSNPEYFAIKLSDDDIIDGAISMTIEDDIKDALDECWDEMLAPQFPNVIPKVPDGYHLSGRSIHLYKWHMA